MLTTDLIVGVRASRTLSAEQLGQLERMVFESGAPSGDQLDLLMLIDSYLVRRDPRWAELLAKAAVTTLGEPVEPAAANAPEPAKAA